MTGPYIPRLGRTLQWLVVIAMLQAPFLALPEEGRPTNLPRASSDEQVIRINLKARRFDPAQIVLTVGEPTALTFHNLDAELHAFVPVGLFTDIHMSITGSGAPEFTDQGLARLIIPPDGTATIHFVPQKTGTYPYFCDMPGHAMRGMIDVEAP